MAISGPRLATSMQLKCAHASSLVAGYWSRPNVYPAGRSFWNKSLGAFCPFGARAEPSAKAPARLVEQRCKSTALTAGQAQQRFGAKRWPRCALNDICCEKRSRWRLKPARILGADAPGQCHAQLRQ